ncbi:MAG: hypothetical protein WAW23_11140 [Candidatus Methanoperedens sp.]
MAIVLFLIFGTITAFLAKRKGYNPYIWFFAAGVIGLIVLAFLPFTNVETLSDDQKMAAKKKGNIIAIVIAILFAILGTLNFIHFRSKMTELKKEVDCFTLCSNIRTALSNYYARQSMGSVSDETKFFPSSLHDTEFLTNSNIEGARLPDHPCGKDWNDFYNSTDGKFNMTAACDCK